jgi:uridine kinase
MDTSLSLDDYIGDVNGVVNDDVIIEEEVDTKTRTKTYIIGIAGGTGAGKTTFAQRIYDSIASSTSSSSSGIVHISHDSYYKDLSHLSLDERAKTNFDHPDSLDSELLIHHLKELIEGRSVIIPQYDFKTHSRCEDEGEVVESKCVILVEGILLFSIKELVQLMDLKIYVDAPCDVRLMRRIERDSIERGRTLVDIISQYSTTVRPMHDEFVEKSKYNADLILYSYDEDEIVSLKRMENAIRVICNHLKMETGEGVK